MTHQDAAYEAEAIIGRIDQFGRTIYMKNSMCIVGFAYDGYWIQDTGTRDEYRGLTRDECVLLVVGELMQANPSMPPRRYLLSGVAGTLGQPNPSVPGCYAWRPCAADDCYAAPDWVSLDRLTPLD